MSLNHELESSHELGKICCKAPLTFQQIYVIQNALMLEFL